MEDVHALFYQLLNANQEAFTHQLYPVAYHALAAAMSYAVHLRDAEKLKAVEQRARDQFDFLSKRLASLPSSDPPLELTLYSSLTEIVHAQHGLLQKTDASTL